MQIFENCLFRCTSFGNIDPRFFALSLVRKHRSVADLTITILNRDFVALNLFDMLSYIYCRKYYHQRRFVSQHYIQYMCFITLLLSAFNSFIQ